MSDPFTYATVFSGIEAPTVAWDSLGWEPAFFSEIEKFPCKVLKHHYPAVPNYGDANKYKEWPDHGQLGLICGGSPCQSFSIAGLRKGMDDPRGNLCLVYLGIIAKYNPRWVIWENVTGVLSSNEGRDFSTFVRGLAELGYGLSWRVLNAQYFGVPQRRRRVFLVGYFGDWRPSLAVLFEPESLRGNFKKSKEERQEVAPTITGGSGEDSCKGKQSGSDRMIFCAETAPTIGAEAYSPFKSPSGQMVDMCISYRKKGFGDYEPDNKASALKSRDFKDATDLIAFAQNSRDEVRIIGEKGRISGALAAEPGMKQQPYIRDNSIVRRFTPVECERLQGFPDNYTLIPGIGRTIKKYNHEIIMYLMTSFGFSESTAKRFAKHPDNVRYKALGNSMATPVVHWIGRRIKLYEELFNNE